MKRIFAAVLGLLALAGATATAADLPRYQPVRAPALHRRSTTGPASISVSTAAAAGAVRTGTASTSSTSPAAWSAAPSATTGRSASSWSASKATSTGRASTAATTALCAAGCDTRNNWLATVRGRLGYAFDRFLPYITGGLARSATSTPPRTGFPAAAPPMPAGPSAAGSNSASSSNVSSRPNISTSISATSIAASIAVSRPTATCRSTPISFAAAQLPVLITARRRLHDQAPDLRSGAFRFASRPAAMSRVRRLGSSRRLGRGEGRHAARRTRRARRPAADDPCAICRRSADRDSRARRRA